MQYVLASSDTGQSIVYLWLKIKVESTEFLMKIGHLDAKIYSGENRKT